METLILIGIILVLVTTLLAIVDHMAEVRGRHRGPWTIAAFVGICFAVVGWLVVAAALVVAGPTREQRSATHQGTAPAHQPGRL
jgi:hypothetical protein